MDDTSEIRTGEALSGRLERAGEALAADLRRPETAWRLRTAPGETEWSALETLGHVVEMIPYWLAHCRDIIAATGEPPHFGRTLEDPERLAAVASADGVGVDRLLEMLESEVQTAGQAIRSLSAAALEKKGIHLRRGEMSVADVLEVFVVSHAEDHLAQVRGALAGNP
jgi:hypothetical protein